MDGYVFLLPSIIKRTSQETEVHFDNVKRSHLSVAIGSFPSILFVSVFQGMLTVTIIMIDSSEKRKRQFIGFELQISRVIEKRNNTCMLIRMTRMEMD